METNAMSRREPEMQNIPVRTEEGRRIKATFLDQHPQPLLDLSEIEKRILETMNDPLS
jgi:DNA polymerase I-like protein with 3'-5' exonuclease and polymerase domains